MNEEPFDRWVLGRAAPLSRRALGGLVSGVVAALGFADVSDAKKKKRKKKKKKGGVSGGGCPTCAANEVCQNKQCSRFRF